MLFLWASLPFDSAVPSFRIMYCGLDINNSRQLYNFELYI
jgi:hypothetical protein